MAGGSPIAEYERDVADMTIAAGPVTASGLERVTVFTGQMSDALVQGFTASVDAVSKTRLALTKLIQPPPIWGDAEGLNATWPVSWAMAQCGVYVSPPPRPGCLWWAPMHGSMHPFLNRSPLNRDVGEVVQNTFGGSLFPRPSFVDGPFVLGLYSEAKASDNITAAWTRMDFAYGDQIFSKAGSAGRLEFWIRGDSVTVGNVTDPYVTYLRLGPFDGISTPNLLAGVDKNLKPFVTVADGAHTTTLTGSNAIPQDGAWHFVGVAWNVAGNKLWVTLDGTTQSTTPSPAMTTTNMVAVDDGNLVWSFLRTYLPLAEVQVTSGATANPDNFTWINDPSYWTPSGVMRPSILDLAAIVEPTPIEAATYISNFAQAELAMTRTDEQDRFCYLPMPYWAETAQQTVAETVSTAANVGTDWSITRDLTKIRNQVVVTYTDARLSNDLATAVQDLMLSFTVYTLRPGQTTITLPLTYLTVSIINTDAAFVLVDAASVAAGDASPGQNIICVNTAADGTGSFNTNASQIDVRLTSWDPGKATIVVTNSTSTTYYTANTGVVPYIRICGTYVSTNDASVTVQDDANVAKRGVRGLSVSLPAIQDQDAATFIANELLVRAKTARKQLSLTVRGDPRRQPGDLLRFTDPNNTNADGLWRVLSVDHSIDGASYTQALTAVEAALIAVWDQSKWDDGSIWGP